MSLVKEIIEVGAPVVVTAVFLYLVIKYFPFFIEAFKKFIELAGRFTTVMENHVDHNTEAMKEHTLVDRELVDAVKRLCIMVEPNLDYKVGGTD